MTAFNFDLIDSAGFGYQRVWVEARYLWRLAMIPIVIKLAATLAVYALGYEDQLLRRGLIMLPATFAEGWVVAQFLRTLLMLERWPMPIPQQNDQAAFDRIIQRARGIVSSVLIFVLINLLTTVIGWAAFSLDQQAQTIVEQTKEGGEAMPQLGEWVFIPALGIMVGMIWAFKLLWLNIPLVLLMPIKDYIKQVPGLLSSIRMLGLFLICMVPLNVLSGIVSYQILAGHDHDLSAAPGQIKFIVILLSVLTDMLTLVIASSAMAYALKDILPRHPQAFKETNQTKGR